MKKTKKNKQLRIDYSTISHDYDRFRSNSPVYLDRIIELANINSASTVLDLGCGTGTAAEFMAKTTSAGIIGADFTFGMLESARAKHPAFNCVNADAEALPFKDESFDAVYSIYMLHHIKNIQTVTQECCRVLRRRKLIIVTSSHKQIEAYHPALKQFFPSYVKIDKQRFYDVPLIERALKNAGFKNIHYEEPVPRRVYLDHELIKKIEHKYVSTYHLIPPDEYSSGIEALKEFVRRHGTSQHHNWNCTIIRAEKE